MCDEFELVSAIPYCGAFPVLSSETFVSPPPPPPCPPFSPSCSCRIYFFKFYCIMPHLLGERKTWIIVIVSEILVKQHQHCQIKCFALLPSFFFFLCIPLCAVSVVLCCSCYNHHNFNSIHCWNSNTPDTQK